MKHFSNVAYTLQIIFNKNLVPDDDITTGVILIIRDSRKLLDTSEIRKCFGPVVIEYGKVQSKVMLKFDNWHKEVLNSFGKLLNEQMIGFHGEIAKVIFLLILFCVQYLYHFIHDWFLT